MNPNLKITALMGSPREGGNTDILLTEALRAVADSGLDVTLFRAAGMNVAPCTHCGGCDSTGVCVIEDEMSQVYAAIRESDRIIVASPVFFFGLPAQLKTVVDRCQALWCEKYLLGRPIPEGDSGRRGLLIMPGGMKKDAGFNCAGMSVMTFFRSISVPSHESLYFPGIDAKGAINNHPTALADVYNAAKNLLR
jgi:hypothetical protein